MHLPCGLPRLSTDLASSPRHMLRSGDAAGHTASLLGLRLRGFVLRGAVLLYSVVVWIGVFAVTQGLLLSFKLSWLFSFVIGLVLATLPLVGTVAAVYGAHIAWGWSWLAATLFFTTPIFICIGAAIFLLRRGTPQG